MVRCLGQQMRADRGGHEQKQRYQRLMQADARAARTEIEGGSDEQATYPQGSGLGRAVQAGVEIWQPGQAKRVAWCPPIPLDEIVRSSANMHMIPADEAVAAALRQVGKDDRVRIDGWLVEVQADDGWRWRSSLTRDDQGQGACEVVYVCAVTRY